MPRVWSLAYLKAHPQFLVGACRLSWPEVAVSHVTGEAVSLVQRQVAALREQYRRHREWIP